MSRIEKALEKAALMRETNVEVPREVVSTHERIVKHTFVPGDLAIDLGAVDKHLVCITDPHSIAAEQFKRLRARIIRATAEGFHNTIMVTSSDVGEGKSSTAINLAVALSNELDYTVLLVDADLRKPTIHKYLGIDQTKGLSNYLKGEVSLPEVLVKTGIGKLVLLPAGETLQNATELLSSERMKMLVQEMKSRYNDRYVIFDSSPLLATADPISLGSHMDGVIFVIREGMVSQKAVRQAFGLMRGWNVLGAVFNGAHKYYDKNRYSNYYVYGRQLQQDKSVGDTGGTAKNE